jgi:hypothetical protein
MGVFKTADGRTLVGIGQQDGNEYSGFNGWRDCVIQLTASGATENSVKYLNAIKDYAIAHNAKGESIMPPNLSVWISNNGATTAVQADDIAVDGENVTICGIKWNGTAWDYTDAGKGGGGGGGAVPQPSDATPQMVGDASSAGSSAQYARADHAHEFDFDTFQAAARPLEVTLVPSSQGDPFNGTYVGATAQQLRAAFLSGRKIIAQLGDQYLTPSILNGNTLNFYFTYESGSVVLFINSRLNVNNGQNSYMSSMYTGLEAFGA